MTDAEKAAAAEAARIEKEKQEGEMPQWAKDLKAQVEKLGAGAPQSNVQTIPPTTPPKTEAEIKAEADSKESKSEKKKGFLDWLL